MQTPPVPAAHHLTPGNATPRTIVVVVFDGVQSLDVTGPMEVFTGASRALGGGRYDVITASHDGAAVRSSSGLQLVPDARLDDVAVGDTLLVPGGDGTREEQPALISWLRTHAATWPRVVGVCTGAFLLAAAGVLDGRRATTHWAYAERLAARFPRVEVDAEPIFVRDGHVATSAGVTAGIDLSLALVEDDHGRDVALAVARYLVVFLRRPGSQHQFSAHLRARPASRDGLREVQRHIAAHPEQDLSVTRLADLAGLSPRHFARAFREETGVTPGRYVDQVRLETARRLLEDSNDGVERVAAISGYGTSETMRRAFVRTLGVAPTEYRRRCAPTNSTSTTTPLST